jgi:NAD(P)-dependent dehydrogenase (short-subunit alcohol dehydrogenase family)
MPAIIPGRHAGKVAIVTGAGQGIGRGVAHRLAQEGAHVVIAEFNADNAAAVAAECSAVGPSALAYPVDVGDVEATARLTRDVAERFGRIDILINNAGLNKTQYMLDLPKADWDRIIRVNQTGLFFCLQAVARQMVEQVPEQVKAAGKSDVSHGKIVNFSSVAGRSGRPYAADYSSTKWAVISITQSAALALAPYNINVNAVCPGIVPTPMWDDIDQTQAARFGLPPGGWIERSVASVPLKRAATPDDLAAAVSFLCSTDADYITGQTLNVDGGLEMN